MIQPRDLPPLPAQLKAEAEWLRHDGQKDDYYWLLERLKCTADLLDSAINALTPPAARPDANGNTVEFTQSPVLVNQTAAQALTDEQTQAAVDAWFDEYQKDGATFKTRMQAAISAALAQQAAQPVGEVSRVDLLNDTATITYTPTDNGWAPFKRGTKLYTTPPAQAQQSSVDAERAARQAAQVRVEELQAENIRLQSAADHACGLLKAQQAAVVSEWRLVPKKCTEAMKDVGIYFEFANVGDGRLLAQTMWNQMLAAAPNAAAQVPEDVRRDATPDHTMREIARDLKASGMACNCDLDSWQPEASTGHSHVCRIHKAAIDAAMSAQQAQGGK